MGTMMGCYGGRILNGANDNHFVNILVRGDALAGVVGVGGDRENVSQAL